MASIWDPAAGGETVNANNTLQRQRFTATANQTTFTLTDFSYVPNTGSSLVIYNGAVQSLPEDYLEISTSSIQLDTPCNAGDVVDIIAFTGISAVVESVVLYNNTTVATAAQVNIPTAAVYRAGTASTAVYRDGVRLVPGVSYTEVDSTSYIVLTTPATVGQVYFTVVGQLVNDIGSEASLVTWQPPERAFMIPNFDLNRALNAGIYNIKWDSRFKQDNVTDNTIFIAENIANAYAENCAIYAPGKEPGFYAAVEGGIDLTGYDNLMIKGDGIGTLFCNVNNAGGALFTFNGARHVRIKDITITSQVLSGSGFVFNGGAHHFILEGVLGCWIDGDACFDIVEAISGRFIGCSVEENNGFDPGGLTDPVRGDTKRAWWVRSQAMGLNNDTNCVACKIDGGGAGSNYALQVGTPGGAAVESFYFQGLIQASERLVRFAAASDCHIKDTHIEPPIGALGDYVVRIENSRNSTIEGRNIQGDILFDGSTNCGLKNVRTDGIVIEPNCNDIFIDTVVYGNLGAGPANGKLVDASMTSRITDTTNSANATYSIGDSLKLKPSKYFSNNMAQFVYIGGTLTAPCGFEKFGVYTPTLNNNGITWSASQFRIDHVGDFTEGFKIRLAPIAQIRGRRVLVDAILLNQLVAGGGYVLLTTAGGATPGTNGQESFQLNRAERMQITFYIPADATSADLIFTGVTGARVNWAKIDIFAEGHSKLYTEDSTTAALATPDISYNGASERGGYPLETVVVGAGANITGFTNPHIGKTFTIRFTAGRTVVSSATLKLAGGVNFVSTADDLLTFEYGLDNVFREIARSVNA